MVYYIRLTTYVVESLDTARSIKQPTCILLHFSRCFLQQALHLQLQRQPTSVQPPALLSAFLLSRPPLSFESSSNTALSRRLFQVSVRRLRSPFHMVARRSTSETNSRPLVYPPPLFRYIRGTSLQYNRNSHCTEALFLSRARQGSVHDQVQLLPYRPRCPQPQWRSRRQGNLPSLGRLQRPTQLHQNPEAVNRHYVPVLDASIDRPASILATDASSHDGDDASDAHSISGQRNTMTARQLRIAIPALSVCLFVSFIDQTSVSTATPAIAGDPTFDIIESVRTVTVLTEELDDIEPDP